MRPLSGEGLDEVWERDQCRGRGWVRSGVRPVSGKGLNEVWGETSVREEAG